MQSEDIKTIAIIGAGIMGNSIALEFARHGYTVRLCDRTQQILDHALTQVDSALETLIDYGAIARTEITSVLDRIQTTTEIPEAVKGAEFVLEAVSEAPDVKKEVFRQLNQFCSEDTILASNTSGLDVFSIAEINNPGRFIITHWFAPAHITPLVEVVPGKETSPEVVARTVKLLNNLGKKTIVLKEFVPAFIVNRLQNAINQAVFEILDNGWVTAADIDVAVKSTLGIRLPVMGVAQVLDFNGLGLINDINQRLGVKSAFLEEKVRKGHTGAHVSKGIYDYAGRSEAELLKKRDALMLKMLDHLNEIDAFEPV